MALGAPSKYSKELADLICVNISTSSKSLRTICKEVGISVQSVLNWLRDNKDFLAQYTRAKEEQADFMCEEMLEIADDGTNDTMVTEFGAKEDREWTSRSKLRVETRKWLASKLKPKKYGDKMDLTTQGEKLVNYDDFIKQVKDA